MKKSQTVKAARAALRAAIDKACIARGEAQWTNGYRTGRRTFDDAEDERLRRKESGQFHYCALAEEQAERAMAAYARAIRAESRR